MKSQEKKCEANVQFTMPLAISWVKICLVEECHEVRRTYVCMYGARAREPFRLP